MIRIELYEVARRLAGREAIDVEARTLGDALEALAAVCPALEDIVVRKGRLTPHWRASLGGRTFVEDPATPLAPGDHLVLVIAMAGG
ncbi:MAG: MoaD/ThiS family protein [Planctomycetota bacterium]